MARKARNEPIMLHSEQETEQKLPFERLPDEPAQWFMRFRTYCQMGRGRSLQAVVAQEKGLLPTEEEEQEAPRGTENENILSDGASLSEQRIEQHVQRVRAQKEEETRYLRNVNQDITVTVPGSWKRASKRWQWVSRAEAYDEQCLADMQQYVLDSVRFNGIYLTKTQRLEALDTLACTLMDALLNHKFKSVFVNENDMKLLLNWVKGMQGVLKDIRKEMSTTDLPLMHRKDF
jgi:hypothetical protein